MYEYDEYYEPSESEEVIQEFTEKMKDLLKTNIKAYFEGVISENERLEEENKKLKDRITEVRNKEIQLESQKRDLMREVRKERLTQLLEDFEVVMYRAHNTKKELPKCDKCNDKRKINFLSPSGKALEENCECSSGKYEFEPKEYICTEFAINQKSKGLRAWYRIKKERDYDHASYDSSEYCKVVYKEGIDYETLNKNETFFKIEEECQKYCDYLNSIR